jgi:uncharacterized protein (DUF302 family)
MGIDMSKYGYSRRLPGRTVAQAKVQVTEALKKEGFGILTEIDVRETLKKKLDVDFREYLILGACNPTLAHAALSKEIEIGLLLPCNVCLWAESDDVVLAIARPDAMFQIVDNPSVAPIATDVDARVRRVLDAMA